MAGTPAAAGDHGQRQGAEHERLELYLRLLCLLRLLAESADDTDPHEAQPPGAHLLIDRLRSGAPVRARVMKDGLAYCQAQS